MKTRYDRQQQRYLDNKKALKQELLDELDKLRREVSNLSEEELKIEIISTKQLKKQIKMIKNQRKRLGGIKSSWDYKKAMNDPGTAGGAYYKALCTILGAAEVDAWLDKAYWETRFMSYDAILKAYERYVPDPKKAWYEGDEEGTYGFTEEEWNSMGPKGKSQARKDWLSQNTGKADKEKVRRTMRNFIIAHRSKDRVLVKPTTNI